MILSTQHISHIFVPCHVDKYYRNIDCLILVFLLGGKCVVVSDGFNLYTYIHSYIYIIFDLNYTARHTKILIIYICTYTCMYVCMDMHFLANHQKKQKINNFTILFSYFVWAQCTCIHIH